MDVQEVALRVQGIAAVAWDYEAAHSREDRLHVDVLRAIADGSMDERSRSLAQAALATTMIQFGRHAA
ncbi:hypothetical protein [Kitasatospora phosalacinea]|uniref:Uncharacterized protein n=1 Tax=Kitasatospora phosalacinea TaxID=2065 RepID=A0ABW6GRE4_9ACTN